MARSVLSGRRTSFPSSTSALSSSSPSSSSQAWKGSFSCLAVWTYGGLSRDSVGVGVGEEDLFRGVFGNPTASSSKASRGCFIDFELSMLSTGSDEAGWGIPAVRIPAVNNDVDDAVPDATKPVTVDVVEDAAAAIAILLSPYAASASSTAVSCATSASLCAVRSELSLREYLVQKCSA